MVVEPKPSRSDLLAGAVTVVFFVTFGMLIVFAVARPTRFNERIVAFIVGVALGFLMIASAARTARVRAEEPDHT
jgi:positive regulator of sigma E activity